MRQYIKQVLLIVKQLHAKGIKHGSINLETVKIRERSKGLEIKLDGIERAILLCDDMTLQATAAMSNA